MLYDGSHCRTRWSEWASERCYLDAAVPSKGHLQEGDGHTAIADVMASRDLALLDQLLGGGIGCPHQGRADIRAGVANLLIGLHKEVCWIKEQEGFGCGSAGLGTR